MSTLHQLVSRNIKFSKIVRPLVPALTKCPQKRGVIQKTIIETPKKPNSAKRKAAKVKLSNGRIIKCYLPGIGHRLSKHSVIMVRGGRCQDLIGVRYKAIFGKFDFFAPSGRVSRLSKFGLSSKEHRLSKNKVRFQYENKLIRSIRHFGKHKNNNKKPSSKIVNNNSNEEYHYDESEYEEKKTQTSNYIFSDFSVENYSDNINISLYPSAFFFSELYDDFDNSYLRYNSYWSCHNESFSVTVTDSSDITLDNNSIFFSNKKHRFSLLRDFSSFFLRRT